MTLIFNLITRTHAIQVSDRRFVRTTTFGDVVWSDDESNKSVFWRSRFAVAFAGLADLGDHDRTDRWIGVQLAEIEQEAKAAGGDLSVGDGPHSHHLGWALNEFAKRATKELSAERNASLSDWDRRQWFTVVGWVLYQGSLQPFIASITNARGPATKPSFDWTISFLADQDGGRFDTAGRPFDKTEFVEHLAAVDATYGINGLFDALCDRMRKVAKSDQHVGRGMLIDVIPKAAVEKLAPEADLFMPFGELVDDVASFHQVAPDFEPGEPSSFRKQVGPIYVPSGGGRLILGTTFGPSERPSS